ncbi:hypothetical protein KKE14_00680 [Patescibacteria group bacterium]|nr:hypothetical protein [Patescibacteria group bacterium]
MSLIFAGAIIYHMLTYSREDFSVEYVRSAKKNLIVYLISGGAILIGSIVVAGILFAIF